MNEAAAASSGSGGVGTMVADHDYTTSVVPDEKRRPHWTMLLTWATFQMSVSLMYTGFIARSQGLTLNDMIVAGVISVVIIMSYGIGACYIGTATGQTHTLVARTVFGKVGSGIASALLILMGMGWYGFQAYFLALILQGLFGFDVVLWSAIFGIVMIFNNLFGFRGVAAYARFVAAPVLLLWGAYTLVKGFGSIPGSVLFSQPHVPVTTSILAIAGLLVGGAAWGNEPDVFRYARRGRTLNLGPLAFGYAVGLLIFPVAGYLMAELSGAKDFAPIIQYFVGFSLFGLTALGVIVFFINQFALNDGNLYESINALQNVLGMWKRWRRRYSVVILGVLGAVAAAKMATFQDSFIVVAGISAVFVPCVTIIMATDLFVVPRLFKIERPVATVTSWERAAVINWVGLVALIAGVVVGSVTGGLVPGLPGFGHTYIGFPPLQSWAVSVAVYLLGVLAVRNFPARDRLLGYPLRGAVDAEPQPVPAIQPEV
jgi:purine-cytosine permease-like protein